MTLRPSPFEPDTRRVACSTNSCDLTSARMLCVSNLPTYGRLPSAVVQVMFLTQRRRRQGRHVRRAELVDLSGTQTFSRRPLRVRPVRSATYAACAVGRKLATHAPGPHGALEAAASSSPPPRAAGPRGTRTRPGARRRPTSARSTASSFARPCVTSTKLAPYFPSSEASGCSRPPRACSACRPARRRAAAAPGPAPPAPRPSAR